jgi:hypothetical protein
MKSLQHAMNKTNAKQTPKSYDKLLLAPFKRAYDRFLRIRGNPREIALGLAMGIVIGMTPLLGLHTIIAIFIAALFKWNKISAVIGVYITNPFTAPFIYTATFYTGSKIMGNGNTFSLPQEEGLTGFLSILLKAPDIFWKMLLGGFLLGLPLAVLGYYISFDILVRYQEDIKRKLAESKKKRAIKKEISKKRRSKKKPGRRRR